ncbi:hypothetical protein BaRGS_00030734 [Batillaria attramentaria]|uniref:AIG1-type G domain-containing protein n=1 Tax=Batillaria attramentaria TaxID=370345 RepID=A0ABD0JSE6_9CAEN
MKRRLIFLWIFFLFLVPAGPETTCEAPEVNNNQPATVTCRFDVDVGQRKLGVKVYKTTPNGEYTDVIKCIWIKNSTELHCTPSPGYVFDGELTRTMVVNISSASAEYMGDYVCQAIPSNPRDLKSCTFSLSDVGRKQEDITNVSKENENEGNTVRDGAVGGVIGRCSRARQRNAGDTEIELDASTSEEKIRVLIVGGQGVGKSSVGNTFCGGNHFPVGTGFTSGTKDCSCYTVSVGNRDYLLVDTPGVCEWETKEETMKVYRELVKSVVFATPGPHVILVVFKCDRFLKSERDCYLTLKTLFGEQMCKHMIVVFTRVDALNTPQNPAPDLASQRNSLEEKLQTASPDLQKILTDAGNRWIGVNNHVREDEQRKFVIKEITQLYEQNETGHYSSEFFQGINSILDKEIENRMKQTPRHPTDDHAAAGNSNEREQAGPSNNDGARPE